MIKNLILSLFTTAVLCGLASAQERENPNFLLISIDDLNDYVGCLGGLPGTKTPHIDALAKRGMLFTNAHCNSPVCNPSRTSFLYGVRPSTSGITSNRFGWLRDLDAYADVVSLPQAMSAGGYTTFGFGKTFHRRAPESERLSQYENSLAYPEWDHWNDLGYPFRFPIEKHLNFFSGDKLTDWGVVNPSKQTPMPSNDPLIANRTIDVLRDRHRNPFLVHCGLFRPHTPLYAPQEFFDLYPLDKISLPETPDDDLDDLVHFGVKERNEAEIEAPGLWTHDWIVENGKWKEILQAYLASISYVDHNVGRVIDTLDKSRYAKNTFIILFSDHGWNLGEKEHWGKAALWEQTTRVPLIVVGPGVPTGVVCDEPVELQSIFPTLAELAKVEKPGHVEGHSLVPLLNDPEAAWDHDALITFANHHALRTDRYRYIRYADGSEELYDHENDPDEFTNLAHPSVAEKSAVLLEGLRARLEATLQIR